MPRRGRHPHNRLTDLMVRQATPGRHCDGQGLQLFVRPNGAKSWVQRIVIHGVRRDLGLGPYPVVTLSEARESALENRRTARSGGDPRTERATKTTPAVREVAEKVFEARSRNWKSESTAKKWNRMFKNLVYPVIGDKPIGDVEVEEVHDILAPEWKGPASTGYVLRQYLDHVFKWARAKKYRADNPAEEVKDLLTRVKKRRKHHPSLPYREIPAAAAAILATPKDPALKLTLLFLVLCVSRFSEAALARWDEINWEKRLWIIPEERMKGGREHVVPLSTQAIKVLELARALNRSRTFVFRTTAGRGIHNAAASRLLAPLELVDEKGKPIVIHGLRTSFRGWAVKEEATHREICEAALAHVEPDKTVEAYIQTEYLEQRIPLMQRWGDYVLPPSTGWEEMV